MKQISQKIRRLSLALASFAAVASVSAATFDDVQYWVGTGANRAAMVIDWKDGKSAESLLWGYRWDGSATGFDMFQAIVNADPRLYAHEGVFSFGTAVFGIGYDLNESGSFGVTPSLAFNGGGIATSGAPVSDNITATDSADHWLEGWNEGFWSYHIKGVDTDAWVEPFDFGAGGRALSDGNWDGYSFAPGFASTDPSAPTAVSAVPEPGTISLCLVGGVLLLGRWVQTRRMICAAGANR